MLKKFLIRRDYQNYDHLNRPVQYQFFRLDNINSECTVLLKHEVSFQCLLFLMNYDGHALRLDKLVSTCFRLCRVCAIYVMGLIFYSISSVK